MYPCCWILLIKNSTLNDLILFLSLSLFKQLRILKYQETDKFMNSINCKLINTTLYRIYKL